MSDEETTHDFIPPPPLPRGGRMPEESPPIATAEFWAEKKLMHMRFLAPSGEFARPNPAFQDYAQARAHGAWPTGKELTEAEFDAAIQAAQTHTFR